MTDQEFTCYMEEKRAYYTSHDVIATLESNVNELLTVDEYHFTERVLACWNLEFLCLTIHTAKGRDLYLKLLTHLGLKCPDMAQKCWKIFDNQDNLKERYNR